MGVRQERRVARTRELLDAAMDLVVEDGMAGLTIGSLAERVEAAVGAIYRYFPSKTALITALQVRAVEELREVVDATLARLDASEAPEIAAVETSRRTRVEQGVGLAVAGVGVAVQLVNPLLGVALCVAGVALLIVSILRVRLATHKHDPYKDVQR